MRFGLCMLIIVLAYCLPWAVTLAPAAEPVPQSSDGWRTSDPVVRLTNHGVALMEQYDYAKAVEVFEQVYKLSPGSPEGQINLAIAMYNRSAKGDLERGEELLDAVLKQEPDNVRALYFRGITHQYRGQDEEAVRCFEQALQKVPHDACAWYLLARSKSHLGQPCRADLERSVQENPALVSAYYDLMRVARQEGDRETAQTYKERFVRLRESPLADKVVMPNYNQMGPLATVQPITVRAEHGLAGGELSSGTVRTIAQASPVAPFGNAGAIAASDFQAQVALGDVNGDGVLDLLTNAVIRDGHQGLQLLLGNPDEGFTDATSNSELLDVRDVMAVAFGDYDNDNIVDLFVACVGPNRLYRGRGDGTFEDVTKSTGTGGPNTITMSAVFLDADHDGDLDVYVVNALSVDDGSPTADQLLNNNADGTFTDLAPLADPNRPTQSGVMLAPIDLDDDRDTDLIAFYENAPARVFFNDRLGEYHEGKITAEPVTGHRGGVAQDFNGDGQPDLLLLPGQESPGQLLLSDGTESLAPSGQFDGCIAAVSSWGDVQTTRVADIDLDGDLDIAVFTPDGHVLLNDGRGLFAPKTKVWPNRAGAAILGSELVDLSGDGVPDVLRILPGADGRIDIVTTKLDPPAHWLKVTPRGDRGGDDRRMRSPASGFGAKMTLHSGVHRQVFTYTGLAGGLSQSRVPVVFGLNGASRADFLGFRWPDGVTQYEARLAASTHVQISEMERRVSSCPVLFAWNGTHFGFISDFAGVGGVGYLAAPGVYAPPQVLEHVKIEPEQLVERNGLYELRLAEPMEEVAYIDRLELLAVDHPVGTTVFPDERLAITGPPPTHRLLRPDDPVFPVTGIAPGGEICTAKLEKVDRLYAYQPDLDHRFVGFCHPHSLELDFADRLAHLGSEDEVFLFINGWIEYPYSQTTYAASQAEVGWDPMRIEQLTADGTWETIVPDAGAPGGLGRMITVDVTGKLRPDHCRLRISTNLEIYFDQLFIARNGGVDELTVTPVPLTGAELRRLGFPLEYSPDGRHPTIYSYDTIESSSSFKTPQGAYTRYGAVDDLLAEFDDRYVILGTGDEIALRFDAAGAPALQPGMTRSFILVSHAYCKDMDLYTAAPDGIEPLPFRSMSSYPYPASEHYPDDELHERYRHNYNTRMVE